MQYEDAKAANYADAVAEARVLVKRSEADQWRLAQLTWEQCQAVTQSTWAADIGVSKSWVQRAIACWQWLLSNHPTIGEYSSVTFDSLGVKSYSEVNRIIRGLPEDMSRYQGEARLAVSRLDPETKAELVSDWLSDDDSGRLRGAVAKVTYNHDREVERRIQRARRERIHDGQRPDFERVQSVQRVIDAYNEVVVAASKMPTELSDHSKSMVAFVATRALPTVQYHAGLEHQHGYSEDEMQEYFFGATS